VAETRRRRDVSDKRQPGRERQRPGDALRAAKHGGQHARAADQREGQRRHAQDDVAHDHRAAVVEPLHDRRHDRDGQQAGDAERAHDEADLPGGRAVTDRQELGKQDELRVREAEQRFRDEQVDERAAPETVGSRAVDVGFWFLG